MKKKKFRSKIWQVARKLEFLLKPNSNQISPVYFTTACFLIVWIYTQNQTMSVVWLFELQLVCWAICTISIGMELVLICVPTKHSHDICHIQPSMPIEITSKQMWLKRKNTIENTHLFVAIIICYYFFYTPVYFYSSSCLVMLPLRTYLMKDKNKLTIEDFKLPTLPKLTQ